MKIKAIEKIETLCDENKPGYIATARVFDLKGEKNLILDLVKIKRNKAKDKELVARVVTGKTSYGAYLPENSICLERIYCYYGVSKAGWSESSVYKLNINDHLKRGNSGKSINIKISSESLNAVSSFYKENFNREAKIASFYEATKAINEIQDDISYIKRQNAENKRLKKIDDVMKLVPKSYKGIADYAHKVSRLGKSGYLRILPFKGKKETEGTCTCCGNTNIFSKDSLKEKNIKCPSCKKMLEVTRSKNSFFESVNLMAIQEMKNHQFVFRYYTVNLCAGKSETTENVYEYARVVTSMNAEDSYYNYIDQKKFWFEFGSWSDKNGSYYSYDFKTLKKSIIYPYIPKSFLNHDLIKGTCFKDLVDRRLKFQVDDFISSVTLKPYRNYLYKDGLYTLADSFGRAEEASLNTAATSSKEILNLTEEAFDRIMAHKNWSYIEYLLLKNDADKEDLSDSEISFLGDHRYNYSSIKSLMDEAKTKAKLNLHQLIAFANKYGRNMFDRVINYPNLEYVAKAGAVKLAQTIDCSTIDFTKAFPKCFGIDKQQMNRLIEKNGGPEMLLWLQTENAEKKRIKDEVILKLVEKNYTPKKLEYVHNATNLSYEKMINYMDKQYSLKYQNTASSYYYYNDILNEWEDYLIMAKEYNMDISNELIYKPKNLHIKHNELAELKNAEKQEKKILEKFPKVNEILGKIQDKYFFSDEKYSIIIPRNVKEIILEGAALNHCVGSCDRYFDRIVRKESYIGFLRKADALDTSWYTIEFEPDGSIRQKRTLGDCQSEELDDCKKFFVKWQKHVSKMLTAEDLELEKQSEILRIESFKELREKGEKVRNGKLKDQLLADVLEADLMLAEVA